MKFGLKFNHRCLHCAILKTLYSFNEKRAKKAEDMQFFLQNVQNEIFKMFKCNISNSPEQPVELTQK